MCDKPIKPVDVSKLPKVEAAPVKKIEQVVKEEKKADDDDFDPFADDDDEEAEKAQMERMKAKAKVSTKPKPVGKSIIVWEVKPWGEDTDLDAMAKKILGIKMEGLEWKTQYKKEPIAFGIFKIAIGAVIVDDLVSTDLVQEKIEEFDDMVQSVDIQSFNKL